MTVPPEDSRLEVASCAEPRVESGVHTGDLALVNDILAGSAAAWERFVKQYSGLMWAVIRRYLPARDTEAGRAIFADLLTNLYRQKLARYEGRALLSTWLTLVARTETVDYLRHRFGRRSLPRGLKRLNEVERVVFRMYYAQGVGFREVLRHLQAGDPSWNMPKLVACLRRIESQVDDRSLRRIAYDLHAQSTGASSGRLLAYLDHVREEFKLHEGAHRPEYHLMEREARRVVARMRELLDALPPEDRYVVTLRFERGWSAHRIAEELGLPDSRGAYTLVDRIVRSLRRKLRHIAPEDA